MGFELVMPFVTTASHGGPHDDDSFVAGWECSRADAILTLLRPAAYEAQVREASVPQMDLIAMKSGYEMSAEPAGDDSQWVRVRMTRGATL